MQFASTSNPLLSAQNPQLTGSFRAICSTSTECRRPTAWRAGGRLNEQHFGETLTLNYMILNKACKRQCYCLNKIVEVSMRSRPQRRESMNYVAFSAPSASGSGVFIFIRKEKRKIPHLSEKGEALPENALFEVSPHASNVGGEYCR